MCINFLLLMILQMNERVTLNQVETGLDWTENRSLKKINSRCVEATRQRSAPETHQTAADIC